MDNGADMEVVFKADNHEREDTDDHEREDTDDHETEMSAPPTPITHCDMKGMGREIPEDDGVSEGSPDDIREGELRHVPCESRGTCSEPGTRKAPRGLNEKWKTREYLPRLTSTL